MCYRTFEYGTQTELKLFVSIYRVCKGGIETHYPPPAARRMFSQMNYLADGETIRRSHCTQNQVINMKLESNSQVDCGWQIRTQLVANFQYFL